jgi:hypothetical protein
LEETAGNTTVKKLETDSREGRLRSFTHYSIFITFVKTLNVVQKFFPLDKNYVLEEAQLDRQEPLLVSLIEKVKLHYELRHNPLQVYDAFSEKIKSYQPSSLHLLERFYKTLAGVYRYKFGNNQLELLWGGENHFDKYKAEWSETFDQWTTQFCFREQFVQAILDLTVFLPENHDAQLAENRMNFVMLQLLAVRIHKKKGIVQMKVA